MRLLLIEFITGGGCLGAPLPASLAEEGDFMLSAVLRDAQSIPGLTVFVPRDTRLQTPKFPCQVLPVVDSAWAIWRQAVKQVDYVLAIAPETDGALAQLNAMILEEGGTLLGCDPRAVDITTSKLQTYERLHCAGVACVPTVVAGAKLPLATHGWVVKPDDGVGSEHAWHASNETQVRHFAQNVPNAIVQPFLEGEALSLSILCCENEVALLTCNRQVQVWEGSQLRQTGVEVNGAAEYFAQMQLIARSVVAAVPGLFGYVGIDLILTFDGTVILEINPRLTTSYVGISESIGVNALDLIMCTCMDNKLPRKICSLTRKPIMVLPHAHH